MLPKAYRLRKSAEFARVRRDGRSRAHPLLILATAPNDGAPTRVGITVGKNVGTAVARNRAKRLLREAARRRLGHLASGHDIVLIGRKDIAGARLDDVSGALDTLLRRAHLLGGTDSGE